MKKFLLENTNKSPMSFNSTKKLYLAFIIAIIGFTADAQCIGPYARFESFTGTGTNPATATLAPNFTTSSTSVSFGSSAANARSGTLFCITNANAVWLMTPAITNPKTFSFYIKTSASPNGPVNFLLEYSSSTDGFVTSTPFANVNTISGVTLTIPTVTTAYSLVTLTMPNPNADVKFRITDTNTRSGTPSPPTSYSGQMHIDDISWISYNASANTLIVPARQGNGVPTDCTGGSVTLGTTDVYNFYDNGGPSDQYNFNQANQVTFTPSNYALGDRIRIQFISYTGAATTDKIEVWDNNGSSLLPANNLLTHTLTTIPAIPTYISTISSDGSVTVKFSSDGAANAAGFNIKVDCVRCPTPTGLASSAVAPTAATLNWNSTSAGAYDIYYSTTNTSPQLSNVIPQVTNLAATTYNLTGLTTGATYYVWVRSRCGSSPDSYSPWSSAISFTTVDCSTFTVATSPSGTAQNLCLNAASTTLTASASGGTVSTYQWYSNTSSSTTGGTAVGTNSGSYTPLTTTAGVLYYYCVMTSTISCLATTTVSGAVTVTAPPAGAPVAGAGSTPTTTSFFANWAAVSGATGYYLDVATDAGFTAIVSGYNNLNIAGGATITYSVTGLTINTQYYYRVRAYNSCGTSVSSNVINIATSGVAYCAISPPSASTTSVNNFSTTGGVSNITNNGTGFTAGGYANYTAQSCSQYPSSQVNYSITSLRTDSTDQTFFYYIWIDWNSNGSFNDAGETILATTSYQAGPFTGVFAIPSGQAAGSYRMRVSTSWVGANTSCSINTAGLGEVEDYTVVVVAVPPCAPSTPSALTTASITATTAVISWTDAAMTPNSVYNYYINTTGVTPTGATVPTGSVTGATSASLAGLTLGNTYYFWVRSNCGTPNPWVGPVVFTTVNQDVVNMTNGNITSCNVRFYDSAGPVSNYANSETYTYTFYPTSATSKLKVVFNSFTTENNYDGFSIYNGNSTAAPLISSGLPAGVNIATCPAGSFYGNNSPGTIFSTAADGSLTFKFTSDNSVVYSGWDATIICVSVPIITSFTPTSVCQGITPTVTLTGTNFTGATSVKFNGVTATYTVNSDTSITTTLPASATTGYITVSNAQATGTSTTVFTVNPIPSVPNAGSPVTICSGSSTTLAATASGTFTTNVLTQDFNAGPWPSTWTRTINGSFNPGDFRTSSEFVSGGNTWAGNGRSGFCSYFYSFSIANGITGDMVTPAMDMTTYAASNLSFWIYNSAGTDNLKVYANNNGGAYTQVGSTYTTYGAWTQITISLNSYVGAGFNAVRIKFSGTSDGGSSNIGIDDVLITGDTTSINTWSPATGLSATNILNPVASPTTTTTYTLTSTYGNGCSTSSNVTITVNPRPTITAASSTANVCYSTSIQTVPLTYSATTLSPITYSITWNASPANSFVAVTDAALTAGSVTISVPANTAGGTYTGNLTVKNASGCASVVSTFTVTVSPQLTITCSSNATAVCGGVSSTVLPFSATSGGAVTYSITWNASPANTFAAVTNVTVPAGTTIPIPIPTGTAAGLYTGNISVKNAAGCSSTPIPFNLNISTQPTVTLAASASPVCFSSSAQTATLSYSGLVGSPTLYTLTWGASAISAGFTNLASYTALPAVIGTAPITLNVPANAPAALYTGSIIVINAGNCQSASLPFTIRVNAKPTLTSALLLDPLCTSSGAQVATMGYTATTNSPTSYSIDWNAAANTAGLLDQGATAFPFINGDDSINNINISASIPANQYTGVMTISNANGCSNSYTVNIYIGKKWNGVTSTNWATASNWTPSGEPTSSDYCVIIPSGTPFSPIISAAAFTGDLTIYTGATVTVNSGVAIEVQDFVKTDGTLTMNNNSSLVQINDVVNSGSGSIVYKRDVNSLRGYDYVYWSSPVASQPINTLYSTPALGYKYYWDTLVNNGNGTGGNVSQGNWAVASGNMSVGKGYIIRGSTSYGWTGNLTSVFTGIPNNGTIAVPIARGSFQGGVPYVGINGSPIAKTDDNMNLIGNPYPSAVKAVDFMTANTNIDGFVYLWTHNSSPSTTSNPFYSSYTTNYFTSDYITYNSSGTSSGPATFNGYIAAGQGFFVAMADGPQDATQSVTFTNAMRSQGYANSQFFKTGQMVATTENDKHRIWIDLVDATNNATRTLVAYCQGATNLKDRTFDAYTKVTNSNLVYSLIGNESQVIQGRALPFDDNDQVPLGYHAETAGSFTIAIVAVDGLFQQGQPIYLQDNDLGIIYDLRSNPYVFSSAQGTFNDRFVLRYTNSLLNTNQVNPKLSVFATISNAQLQIKANENIASVQVYDVTGKLVKAITPTTKSNQLKEDFSFEKGVYFAKIRLEEGTLITQKIIN